MAVRLDGPGSVRDGRIHPGCQDTAGSVLVSLREKRICLQAGGLRRRGFWPSVYIIERHYADELPERQVAK